MSEPLAKLRLARTEGVGPLTYQRLLARFATAAEAIHHLPELARAGGRAIMDVVSPATAEREVRALAKLGGRMLFLGDASYPPLLAMLPDPPPVISLLGDATVLAGKCVGLVGARNASANGQRMAEALAADLAASGLIVVSGLARGIDAAAHTGAMHTGRTIAAIAGGLDQPYPPEHADLQAQIAANGAVVSEAPLGTAPQSRHFPRRNRIIAGLSLGVVVVEAALRSGSLITARLALDANRELFAVPGSPLDPRCHGTNQLIREGAHLTESAADVLAQLPDHPAQQAYGRAPLFNNGLAERAQTFAEQANEHAPTMARVRAEVVTLLGAAPTEIDVVIRHSQFAPSAVMAALSQLELALAVEILPGSRVCLLAR
jgi:DNA processing protein